MSPRRERASGWRRFVAPVVHRRRTNDVGHELLGPEQFSAADRDATKSEHRWVFPVDSTEHTLTGDLRALFEQVRNDPRIEKIVLTRSRHIDLPGTNVTVVPLMSAEGQRRLIDAKTVFVTRSLSSDLPWPISTEHHRVIHIGDETPAEAERPGYTAVVAAGRFDALTKVADFWPLKFDHVWATGMPRHDFLTCRSVELPDDLRVQEDELRTLIGDRGLVLVLVRGAALPDPSRLPPQDGATVWGVRGTATSVFSSALDLGTRSFPDLEVLLRVASMLVSDDPARLNDFRMLGRPVVDLTEPSPPSDQETDPPRLTDQVHHGAAARVASRVRELSEQAQQTSPDR